MANRLCGNNVNSVLNGRFVTSGALAPPNPSPQSQINQSVTFTNTAKLPIETVKRLIAAVAGKPNLWIRNHNGHRRGEINLLWNEVSTEVNLPVDICRIKWGHLRDNFRKVFIRNKLSGETPTTWRFYNDMCFMEGAVAENVLRQNRYKEVSRHLLDEERLYETTKDLFAHPSVPICELRETYEREPQQFNFPYSMPEFFNESQRQQKRIKLEPQSFEMPFAKHGLHSFDGKHGERQSQFLLDFNQTGPNTDPDLDPDPDPEDDDFDEDAATEEDQVSDKTETNTKSNKRDVFTIEVFDDEDDEDRKNINNSSSLADTEETESKVSCSRKSVTLEAATTTDSSGYHSQEADADRMFLLSLLPYLRNIDEKRKLHVRQKLQRVLIDELG